MKSKTHTEIKDSFLLVNMLSEECIASLNKRFGTHITKAGVKKQVRIQRKQEKFGFWDKLMRRGSRDRI